MDDEPLLVEAARRQGHGEVDGGVVEFRIAHERLGVGVVVDAREHFLCRLDGDALDAREVAVIGDADGDADVEAARGHAEVRDVCARNGLVRNDDGSTTCTERDDGGETPCDVGNASLLARAETDVVADADLL